MAWASTYTLLSLDRYAKIMGIVPAHFQGAAGSSYWPVKANRNNDLWPQYSWQAQDRVSREDLARAIANAEYDIASVLGYWPAPKWIEQDVRKFPQYYRRDLFRVGGGNIRGSRVGVNAAWGKIISPGQRATSLVADSVAVVYSDEDGDGWDETATISFATTLTEACELKVYFEDKAGAQEWEIRPAKSKSISGGTATLVFDSWLFVNPDLMALPTTTDDFTAINIDTTGNYVTNVDVYREYTDTTGTSAVFYWEPTPERTNVLCPNCGGAGCQACTLTTQDGCIHIRDAEAGIVVPTPATYDSDDAAWGSDVFTVCRDPDYVKVWYYAGLLDNRWLRGVECDPLPLSMAEAITWMATARLERPFCAGTVATALFNKLQTDLATTQGDTSFFVPESDMSNPFGTRRGEILAWRRISKLTDWRMLGVAV